MDEFFSSRCLNYCINVPNKIGSFSRGATTSMVVKMELKKTFEIFFSSIHASQKLLYSLHFSTYKKMVNSTRFYGPSTTTFAHKVLISTTFVTKSFDFKMTYFLCWYSKHKLLIFRCKLRLCGFRILKKIGNWLTNEGSRAISIRCVLTKI